MDWSVKEHLRRNPSASQQAAVRAADKELSEISIRIRTAFTNAIGALERYERHGAPEDLRLAEAEQRFVVTEIEKCHQALMTNEVLNRAARRRGFENALAAFLSETDLLAHITNTFEYFGGPGRTPKPPPN